MLQSDRLGSGRLMTASTSGPWSETKKSPVLICGILGCQLVRDELDVIQVEWIVKLMFLFE